MFVLETYKNTYNEKQHHLCHVIITLSSFKLPILRKEVILFLKSNKKTLIKNKLIQIKETEANIPEKG